MILRFKKVSLVNFGSYASATIGLGDKGFCLVSGENHCAKDNALSNGSGKSTIWSAVCYALTGETIGGLTNNLMNVNAETDDCSVELDFCADDDEYKVTRIYKPKSDLKIIKNGADISGKGVRESEKALAENLPDLTKDLIASTVILGQGMPNKFSSFTPSGRKALLEKLTKSDFMVEDIKNRIAERQATLGESARKYSDSILVNKTNLESAQRSLASIMASLKALEGRDYDSEIAKLRQETAKIDEELDKANNEIVALEANVGQTEKAAADAEEAALKENGRLEGFSAELVKANEAKSTALLELNESYTSSVAEAKTAKYSLEAGISNLGKEIAKRKSIKDVCPTCGQKLPNVVKPDTSGLEVELAAKQVELKTLEEKLAISAATYSKYKSTIDEDYQKASAKAKEGSDAVKAVVAKYRSQAAELRTLVAAAKNAIARRRSEATNMSLRKSSLTEELVKANLSKESFVRQKTALEKQAESLNEAIIDLQNAIVLSESAKNDVDEHMAVLKKMTVLTQRDFRGYLLEDIIRYIDERAKDYCQVVFETTDLDVYLDGNALDISYCGKMFDSLSGGEKQRCDLILQFAIRDLLQNYLNYSSNILVLDEIFDGLDKKSTDKVIELITERLKDIESTFVVSHHSDELELPIDSEIRVVKNENGISEAH